MFGWLRRKKEEKNDRTVHDEVFGDVVFYGCWTSVETVKIPLFGSYVETRLLAGSRDKSIPINDIQREECIYFRQNLELIANEAESLLQELMKGKSPEDIAGSIGSMAVYFSRDGESGIYIKTDLRDEELEEYGIGPEDDLGIVLRPEPRIIRSGDEFLDRFAY